MRVAEFEPTSSCCFGGSLHWERDEEDDEGVDGLWTLERNVRLNLSAMAGGHMLLLLLLWPSLCSCIPFVFYPSSTEFEHCQCQWSRCVDYEMLILETGGVSWLSYKCYQMKTCHGARLGHSSCLYTPDSKRSSGATFRNDITLCNNTVQGRALLSDSRGYVCSIMAVDPTTACCPEAGEQFSCRGCNLTSQCCNSYEYCVACCMDPTRTAVEVALKTKVARQATAGTCTGLFDYCSGRCRHNSESVVHENAYASEEHHCFSLQLNASVESGETGGKTKLADVSIIVGRQGQSCDGACKGSRLSCKADKLSTINTCAELRKYMRCTGLCVASLGADQPAEVVSTAPRHLHPGACLFSTEASLLSCQGSHPYTRRLCPCS